MKVTFEKRLIDAPPQVVTFVLEQHLALRKRYSYVLDLLHGREQTMWAGTASHPLGALLWKPYDDGRTWWVDFACTHPDARSKGIYLLLRSRLVARARRDPMVRTIESHVATWNTRMQDLNKKVGATQCSVRFRYAVRGV